MPVLIDREPLPGAWGSGLYRVTLAADNDGMARGVGLIGGPWPPAFFRATNPSSVGQVQKQLAPPPASSYTVRNYLVSFDTSMLNPDLHAVLSAELMVDTISSGYANVDGRSVDCDSRYWGSLVDSGDYVAPDQPGADGSVPLASVAPDIELRQEDLLFSVRPRSIYLGGVSQFRLTISGDAPVGANSIRLVDIKAAGSLLAARPRLAVVLAPCNDGH